MMEHPDFFFCHGCDLLEDAVESNIKRASRKMKKYMCTCGHSEVSHPTTLKMQYRPKSQNAKPPIKVARETDSFSDASAAADRYGNYKNEGNKSPS
jgi:hypothetical protein